MFNRRLVSLLAVVLLGITSSGAYAEDKDGSDWAQTLKQFGQNLTPEQKKSAEAAGRAITQEVLKASRGPQLKPQQEMAAQAARRADDIADAALAKDRADIQRFLGIDPNGQSSLYFFVSSTMPIEMLRAYVIEAMWSGGTLVFRGVPPGMDIKDFITKYLSELIYGKGASASIAIDPRLFEAYNVTVAPTVVYTEERRNFECQGVGQRAFRSQGRELTYETCPPIDESKYWKLSGAVTADYALHEFINAGAKGAQPYLDALAKGFATGERPPKSQVPFAGDWKQAITPEDLKRVQDAVETAKSTGAKP